MERADIELLYEIKKEVGVDPLDYDNFDDYFEAAMAAMKAMLMERHKEAK